LIDYHLSPAAFSDTLSLVSGAIELRLAQDNIKSEEIFNVMNNVVWDMLHSGLKEHMDSGLSQEIE